MDEEKVMCSHCREEQYYFVEEVFFNSKMTGSGREYMLTKAKCVKCNHIVRVPHIIDKNIHSLMCGDNISTEMTESLFVGERIRELRKERTMKQNVLAEKAGIDIGFLAKIERGRIHINEDLIRKFAEIFNVSLKEISYLY